MKLISTLSLIVILLCHHVVAQKSSPPNNYQIQLALSDSIWNVSVELSGNVSYDYERQMNYLLFNSDLSIDEFLCNEHSSSYLLQNDTLFFTASSSFNNIKLTYSLNSILSNANTPNTQFFLERFIRWYPLLYDQFSNYKVTITLPGNYFVQACSKECRRHVQGNIIHYEYKLFDEDFPIFISKDGIYDTLSLTKWKSTLSFYYIRERPRFLSMDAEGNKIFTSDSLQKDSLIHIIAYRTMDAFRWYNENLWKLPRRTIRIVETLENQGVGFDRFILAGRSMINLELWNEMQFSHEAVHSWIGSHTLYVQEGKFFMGESVAEFVNWLYYKSWAGDKAFEKLIDDMQNLTYYTNIEYFTTDFQTILSLRKSTAQPYNDLYFYIKGPLFVYEFYKLIGEEKLFQIIRYIYKPRNRFAHYSLWESAVKKFHCEDEWRQVTTKHL